MSLVAFDTHSFVKRLMAAGMPEAQAEILAEERTADLYERLASKDDLERQSNELRAEIERQSNELRAEMEKLRLSLIADTEAKLRIQTNSLVKWVAAMLVGQIVVLVTLLDLLGRIP